MIKVECKTIWMGKVAVRDKYIDEALDTGEGIVITHGEDVMEIPFNEIKQRIVGRSALPVKDRFSPNRHFLFYLNWKPTIKQFSLIENGY